MTKKEFNHLQKDDIVIMIRGNKRGNKSIVVTPKLNSRQFIVRDLSDDQEYVKSYFSMALEGSFSETKEEKAIKLIKANCFVSNDDEKNHEEADCILCDFLEELGYKDLVQAFNLVKKYYS